MTDRDRQTPTNGAEGADGTGGPEPARGDRKRAHAESSPNTRDRPPKPMTDDYQTERTNRAATKSNRTTSSADRPRRRVKDRDHTSSVDGHNRTFSRANEGRPAKTDGGRRTDADEESAEDRARTRGEEASTDDDGTAPADEGRVRRRVKDRDHTSPVDGHNRTFERGEEDPDAGK